MIALDRDMGTAASVKKDEGSKAAGKPKAKAKAKKKSRGKPVRVWRIVNDGYIHKIEFYHNLISGARTVVVDNVVHQDTKLAFNLVGEIKFEMLGKHFLLEIKTSHSTVLTEVLEYNLFIDGKLAKTLGKHARWETKTADGSPIVIIFEFEKFAIYANNLPVDAHTGFGSDDGPGSTYTWTHGDSEFLLQLYRASDMRTAPQVILSMDGKVLSRVNGNKSDQKKEAAASAKLHTTPSTDATAKSSSSAGAANSFAEPASADKAEKAPQTTEGGDFRLTPTDGSVAEKARRAALGLDNEGLPSSLESQSLSR